MKVTCPSCRQRFKTSERSSGDFELRGGYENKPVVKCLRCGQLIFARPFTRRVQAVPPDVATYLEEQWGAWTSPYETAMRYAEREERRQAYRGSVGETEPLYEGPGIPVPAWWYFWERGLDQGADINRVLFLPENMPPELEGKTVAELDELGLRQIPGEKAMELLIQRFVDDRDVPLSAAGQRAFAEGYMRRVAELQGASI